MGLIPPALHHSARPIHVSEFAAAVTAACKPRFSSAYAGAHAHAHGQGHGHAHQPRPIGLAVSGGVDSMALAYLCSQLHRLRRDFRIAGHPLGPFHGFVVDHGLREGSGAEARSVGDALQNMGIQPLVRRIEWEEQVRGRIQRHGDDVESLPNMETLARRERYRVLGRASARCGVATLMLAHHEDDQYETTLMRLLARHHRRGLRGMQPDAPIPECEGIFGAHQSGWLDDRYRCSPFGNIMSTHKQRQYTSQELGEGSSGTLFEDEDEGAADVMPELKAFNENDQLNVSLGGMPIEDGGVHICRPLLEFSKDRLIATCLQNRIPWWDDQTNKDPTLTTRNAVRHLWNNFALPKALQKPAVLGLARNINHVTETREAEAGRLLKQTVLHNITPRAGTMVIQFPEVMDPVRSRKDRFSSIRRCRRLAIKREVAGLLIRRILALLSPEGKHSPLATLQNVISFLFPSLSTRVTLPKAQPTIFTIAGLRFLRVSSAGRCPNASKPTCPRTWYVARLPYATGRPPPSWRTGFWAEDEGTWSPWLPWQLWDNRYWIRLKHRLPCRVVTYPLLAEHLATFRASLPPPDRQRLQRYLKLGAPGKVRYTLPAIYSEEHLDLDNVQPRSGWPNPETEPDQVRDARAGGVPAGALDPSKMRLLTLPTLDSQVPGLGKWLMYDIRFKRMDRDTLRATGTFTRQPFRSPGPPSTEETGPRRIEKHWSRAAGVRHRAGMRIRRRREALVF